MARRRPGEKPLSEPMIVSLLTLIIYASSALNELMRRLVKHNFYINSIFRLIISIIVNSDWLQWERTHFRYSCRDRWKSMLHDKPCGIHEYIQNVQAKWHIPCEYVKFKFTGQFYIFIQSNFCAYLFLFAARTSCQQQRFISCLACQSIAALYHKLGTWACGCFMKS